MLGLAGAGAHAADPSVVLVERVVADAGDGVVSPRMLALLLAPSHRDPRRVAQILAARLGAGGDLGPLLAEDPAVLAVLPTPQGRRVVLDTRPFVTAVVVDTPGGPRLASFDLTPCGACDEAERWVRTLLADVRTRDDAARRLLPGLELDVSRARAADDPADPEAPAPADLEEDPAVLAEGRPPTLGWLEALNNRNVRAGYLWTLLRGAEVVGRGPGDGVQEPAAVHLTYGDGTGDTWWVRWSGERWVVDYARLPAESLLRLATEDVASWRDRAALQDAAVALWTPAWWTTPHGTLVAGGVQAVLPRPLEDEVVVVRLDPSRSWGLVAVLDLVDGAVLRRVPLPVPSRKENISTLAWGAAPAALDPSGRVLAVAWHNRIFLVDTVGGRLLAQAEGPWVTALAWAPDGASVVAVGEGGLLRLLDSALATVRTTTTGTGQVVRWVGASPEGWITVDAAGDVRRWDPDLAGGARVGVACCGELSAAGFLGDAEAVGVACTASCVSAWLWSWGPESGGHLQEDAALQAPRGVLAGDPDGPLVLVPHPGPDVAGALWDRRRREVVGLLPGRPLLTATWLDGRIYGVDDRGEGWIYDPPP